MTTPAPGSSPSTAPAPADGGSRVVPLVDLHGRSAWSILPPLILGFFMIMVDTTIVNIAVPTLQTELDASLVAVGWVNSAYLLSYAVLLLLAGRLGDRYGPKPVFVVGLAVFTIASAWCGFSGSIEMLIAARVVQGVGAALSPALAGWVAQHHGYGPAFMALSGVAALSLALLATQRMPRRGILTGAIRRPSDANSSH